MKMLKVIDIKKIYGKGENEIKAVNGITLEMEPHKFSAIIGQSGSGKSTLLHCMAGLDKLTLGNELSGGQQQRVAIARSLANKPSIIFADEPTGNLDSKTTDEVMNLLKYCVNEYKQTLVMITHSDEIAKMADCIITISDGKVI